MWHIWFETARTRMRPDMNFLDFARDHRRCRGELYGHSSNVQETVAQASALVGVNVPLFGSAMQLAA